MAEEKHGFGRREVSYHIQNEFSTSTSPRLTSATATGSRSLGGGARDFSKAAAAMKFSGPFQILTKEMNLLSLCH